MSFEIDYVEFSSPALAKTEEFFSKAFGWKYEEYGDNYRHVENCGTGAGIENAELRPPLVVVNTDDLVGALESVKAAGGEITKEVFSFPGGRRFQFREPGGNEIAVSTKE